MCDAPVVLVKVHVGQTRCSGRDSHEGPAAGEGDLRQVRPAVFIQGANPLHAAGGPVAGRAQQDVPKVPLMIPSRSEVQYMQHTSYVTKKIVMCNAWVSTD